MALETDALNERFQRAAAKLAELGLAVEAQVLVTEWSSDDDPVGGQWDLAFVKRGDAWGLVLRSWSSDDPEHCSDTPITSAPRWLRVMAATRLPDLLAKMRSETQREAEQVRAARQAVDAFLASLGETGES